MIQVADILTYITAWAFRVPRRSEATAGQHRAQRLLRRRKLTRATGLARGTLRRYTQTGIFRVHALPSLKPVVWVGPSRRELKALPREVQRVIHAMEVRR